MNPASDPREILVIGYGNTLRGDDGVGPMLATAVAEHWPEVRSIAAPQLTPEMAESLAGARAAVFIDARLGLAPPDVVVASLVPCVPDPMTAHACDPQSLLAIARDLFGHAPPAWMVTVTGTDFGLSESLSAACQGHAREAMKRIKGLIRSFGQGRAESRTD